MIIAKTKDKNSLIKASEASRNTTYICPGCLGDVILKRGEINQPHFAHVNNNDCSDFAENESFDHLKAKLDLYNQLVANGFKDIQLEKVIPRIKQRPDVFLKLENGHKIAFELQFSPISLTRLRQRTSNYQMAGIQVFWLLGTTYKLENSDQNTIAKFMDIHNQIYLWRDNIFVAFNFNKSDFHKTNFTLQKINFKQLIDGIFPIFKEIPIKSIPNGKNILKLQSLVIDKKVDKQVVNQLYKFNGKNLSLIPNFAHQGRQFGLSIPNWQWRLKAVMLIEKAGVYKLINKQGFINLLSDQKYFYPRSVDNGYRIEAAMKLVDELVELKILIRAGDYLIVRNSFIWFDTLESKLNQVKLSS